MTPESSIPHIDPKDFKPTDSGLFVPADALASPTLSPTPPTAREIGQQVVNVMNERVRGTNGEYRRQPVIPDIDLEADFRSATIDPKAERDRDLQAHWQAVEVAHARKHNARREEARAARQKDETPKVTPEVAVQQILGEEIVLANSGLRRRVAELELQRNPRSRSAKLANSQRAYSATAQAYSRYHTDTIAANVKNPDKHPTNPIKRFHMNRMVDRFAKKNILNSTLKRNHHVWDRQYTNSDGEVINVDIGTPDYEQAILDRRWPLSPKERRTALGKNRQIMELNEKVDKVQGKLDRSAGGYDLPGRIIKARRLRNMGEWKEDLAAYQIVGLRKYVERRAQKIIAAAESKGIEVTPRLKAQVEEGILDKEYAKYLGVTQRELKNGAVPAVVLDEIHRKVVYMKESELLHEASEEQAKISRAEQRQRTAQNVGKVAVSTGRKVKAGAKHAKNRVVKLASRTRDAYIEGRTADSTHGFVQRNIVNPVARQSGRLSTKLPKRRR